MARPIALVVAGALAVSCGTHGSATPAPVGAQLAPATTPAAALARDEAGRTTCEGRVDARGHVAAADIVPAMLDGTHAATGSWHLAAARSITTAACRGDADDRSDPRGTDASVLPP